MLSGILYLHRISDNRMAGTPLKNLRMFNKLCGKSSLHQIILATTMWHDVRDDEGEIRETELREKYWKAMTTQGSTVARFLGTFDSAWDVIGHLLFDPNDRIIAQIQREMVDLKKQLPETKAGRKLYTTLEGLVHKQRETLRQIKEATNGNADQQILNQLNAEYDGIRKKLEVTIAEMQELKLSLGTRLLQVDCLRNTPASATDSVYL